MRVEQAPRGVLTGSHLAGLGGPQPGTAGPTAEGGGAMPVSHWDTAQITARDVQRSRTSRDLDGLRRAVDAIAGEQVERLLDVGCGFGGLARLVGDSLGATEVHGVDVDRGVVDEARAKNVQVSVKDVAVEPLPFEDEYFDVVMSMGMMDYLDFFDPLIRELARVTRISGTLIVSLPNLASWHNRLALLLGYQPRDVEISSEILAGVLPWPTRSHGQPAGHLHVPAVRAFVQLMEHHGYATVKVLPGRPKVRANRIVLAVDRLASLSPSTARRFYYVGRRIRRTALRPLPAPRQASH